jgi:hypothetical protein
MAAFNHPDFYRQLRQDPDIASFVKIQIKSWPTRFSCWLGVQSNFMSAHVTVGNRADL